MKRFILLLFSFPLAFAVQAQDKLRFTLSTGNYAYLGIPNPFSYASENKNLKIFKCESGIFVEEGSRVFKASKLDTTLVYVYSVNGNDTVVEHMQSIIIRKMPDPTIAIKGKEVKEFSRKTDFHEADSLDGFLDMDIEAFKNSFSVVSFDLAVVNNNKTVKYSGNGKLITPEMKKAFSLLQTGDKLIFEQVKLHGPDGTTRYLGRPIITTIR